MSEPTRSPDAASVDERCSSCGGDGGDNWFDRSICPPPCDSMHTRCVKCGTALDGCPLEDELGPRIDTSSEVGSLPDTKEGRYEGQEPPAATLRPWWDIRAAWIVFWRVRESVTPRRPWSGWRATFKAWWMVGHGKHLVS